MKIKMYKLRAALIITLANLLISSSIFAQSPERISYQAVIRTSDNALVTNQTVGMRISIQKYVFGNPPTYQNVYVETQRPTSNANGLVSIAIGAGTVVGGTFDGINWADGTYFIKTETDPAGGTTYTITGTSQLLSVPYALHAKTVETVPIGTQTGQMLYWNGTAWVNVPPGNTGNILTMINGVPTWGGPGIGMGTNDVYNPITGRIWSDRNLGATQVATSSTDANAYGHLYQWGRAADGHQIRTSGTTATLATSDTPGHGNFITNLSSPFDWRSPQNNNLWQGVSGTNNPCPSGYRLPTEAEWDAERSSWSSNNAAGAFASPLKLPVAGYRSYSNGTLAYVGSLGYYWSSTVSGTHASNLFFSSGNANVHSNLRTYGFSVRCLKD